MKVTISVLKDNGKSTNERLTLTIDDESLIPGSVEDIEEYLYNQFFEISEGDDE